MRIILFGLSLLIFSCQGQTKEDKNESTPQLHAESEGTEASEPFQDISVEEFQNKLSGEDVVVLDVRRPDETAEGKIGDALELNVLEEESFREGLNNLDKGKTYLVYCRSGRRSVTASNIMAEMGFESIYNLVGGYTAWKEHEEKN